MAPVRARLDAAGYKYEIKARVKSAYSIYNKMETKKIPFEEIYDIYAVRVIFENDNDEKERVDNWGNIYFFLRRPQGSPGPAARLDQHPESQRLPRTAP